MKRKENSSSDHSSIDLLTSQLLDTDLGILVQHTFGEESLKTIFTPDLLSNKITQNSIVQNTNVWISTVLEGSHSPPLSEVEEDNRPGRLGLPQVRFDSTAQVGTLIMSPDRLHAQSQSNFSTVRSNVCCFSGKWQYELQLESKGVMQLGWSMNQGEFTPESGVGDTIYSYAYDGNRIRKWNLITTEYGEAWQTGDIVGCTIDLDVGSIHFYRNGKDLGEAFSSLSLGPGCVYYAAISLAFEEKCLANFGSTPFKFPVEPYLPMQQPPTGAIARTDQLLYWLTRISSVPKRRVSLKNQSADLTKSSPEAVSLLFTEMLMNHLSRHLTQPYVVDACLIPFLHEASTAGLDKHSLPAKKPLAKINFFFDSLALFLEIEDCKEVINAICKCLVHKFNQTASSLDYDTQKYSLDILSDICQNNTVRKTLLKQPAFLKLRIPQFMDVKPIDTLSLKQCVPQCWWESKGHTIEGLKAKQAYLADCDNIRNKTLELERLQEAVLLELLTNDDGTYSEASSRKYFLHMFRLFLKVNHITSLVSAFVNNQVAELTPLPRALSVFHRLVSVLRQLWQRECLAQPICVPTSVFYCGEVNYFSIERVGGVTSHLVRTLRPALVQELGEDHGVFTEPTSPPSSQPTVHIQVRGLDPSTGVISPMTRWFNVPIPFGGQLTETPEPEMVAPGAVSSAASLVELLDGAIMLYNLAAHKQLQKISTLRDEMDKYIQALNEAKKRKKSADVTCPQAAEQIEISIQAFERKVEEQSQVLMAWVRGAVYTPEKRDNLVWLLKAVLLTLERASEQGDLFGFVPEYYLDTMVEICSALRSYFNPTLPLEQMAGYKRVLQRVAEFLANHFADPRIVNPHSKDLIIEAIGSFVAKKLTLECFENISVPSQERFVRLLLRPYDNLPWGQVNWILMRMWQGDGFAFRYHVSPHLSNKLGPRTPTSESGLLVSQAFEPCPSSRYQQLVARILSQDQETAVEFLNSVLKQLNWTFSEFISMLQEIQNLAKKPERVIIDARQLKICATCYDLVIALLRVLEMLCSACLHIFTDASREGTENLLERLCQLLSQILLRVTSPGGTFSQVISLEVPDLDAIDQFPVLAAVAGTIVALLADDLSMKDNRTTNMTSTVRCLLSEPSFDIESLKYLIGESEHNTDREDRFSFENYPEVVSGAEIQAVRRLIYVLSQYKARMSIASELEDEELCPICCAMPLTVTFMPCRHQSCKSCITHYLMDCKECFFCKAAISSVLSKDGRVLFDSSASSQQASNHNHGHHA